MTFIHLYDRAMIEAAPGLPLDDELRGLLAERVAHLDKQDLLDMTEIAVVDGNTTEADIVDALGFSPLDGVAGRFGEPGFVSTIDYAARVSPSYQEAIIITDNSGYAFQLLVHDDADSDLVALLAELAA